jgi:transketolase
VVIEKYFGINAESLLKKHGDHPVLSEEDKIYCTTGSLGMGITVAVGRALANKNKQVYCMISDGECSEGSVWESLKYLRKSGLENIEIHVNMNGWGAFHEIEKDPLEKMLTAFYPKILIHHTTVEHYGLSGQEAHYVKLTEEQYRKALENL